MVNLKQNRTRQPNFMQKQKQNKSKARKESKRNQNRTKITKQPSARSYSAVSGNKNTRRVIKNRELIREINSSINFTSVIYRENPGFSHWIWASQQAKGYERYRVRKLSYEIVPLYGNTDAKGKFFLAFDLDANDGKPPDGETGMRDLVASEYVVDTPSWKSARLSIPANKLMSGIQTKTVRHGPVIGSLREYDMGSVIVGTVGFDADGSKAGQLYVDYEIELISPQVATKVPSPRNVTTYEQGDALDLDDNTFTPIPWQPNPIIAGHLSITLDASNTVFTLHPGTYFITCSARNYSGADVSAPQENNWTSRLVVDGVNLTPFSGTWLELTQNTSNYLEDDDRHTRSGYYHSDTSFTVALEMRSNVLIPATVSQNVYSGCISFQLVC